MGDLREVVAQIISGAPFPSKRSYAKADAVLSALSDRSHSEVGGDVVEQVGKLLRKFHRNSCYPDALDAEVSLYTLPIIEAVAADAERRVRAEDAAICDAFAERKEATEFTSASLQDEANVARWLARRIRGEVSDD